MLVPAYRAAAAAIEAATRRLLAGSFQADQCPQVSMQLAVHAVAVAVLLSQVVRLRDDAFRTFSSCRHTCQ